MFRCALVFGVVAAAASAACAGVTWTSSRVEVIDPPVSVLHGQRTSDEVAFVFEEGDGHTLESDLPVASTRSWEAPLPSLTLSGVIPNGNRVRSYFVHLDRITNAPDSAARAIRFDEDVLGVIAGPASDFGERFKSPGTQYTDGFTHTDPTSISISSDRRTVFFNLGGQTNVRQFRVITSADRSAAPDCFDPFGCAIDGVDEQTSTAVVTAIESDDEGIYVAGKYTIRSAGLPWGWQVARYGASGWSGMPGGPSGPIRALSFFDDGSGMALWAGGLFTSLATGQPAARAARWTESFGWEPAGSGLPGQVIELEIHDDGTSPGLFAVAQLGSGWQVFRWSGTAWDEYGPSFVGVVESLRSVGHELYALGQNLTTQSIMSSALRIDGDLSVGTLPDQRATVLYDLVSHSADDETAVFGAGVFRPTPTTFHRGIARLIEGEWHLIDGAFDRAPSVLISAPDLSGSQRLFAAGAFNRIDGVLTPGVAMWDGDTWSPLRGGLGGGEVLDAAWTSQHGLTFVGDFSRASYAPSFYIAAWRGCRLPCVSDVSGDGIVGFEDLNAVLAQFGAAGSDLIGDITSDGIVDFDDLNAVLATFGPCEPPCAYSVSHPLDCNGNLIPDTCDLAQGISNDCNGNSVPDACDIAGGSELDCNMNGIIDQCELGDPDMPDCNANGIPDCCDIASGLESDCQGNGVPDSCEIANGTSTDCDDNGVPDVCQPDCDRNWTPDVCDILNGDSQDCNGNWIADSCEFGPGDDCNGNGIPDACDILSGASADLNNDTVPDDCQPDFCPGDVTGDGLRNNSDLNLMLAAFDQPVSAFPQADVNRDGVIDFSDVQILLVFFGVPCAGG